MQVATFGLEHVAERDAEVTLVALTGELDLTNVEDLDRQLGALAYGLPLVLDLVVSSSWTAPRCTGCSGSSESGVREASPS